MSKVAGDNNWVDEIEMADDGDPASGATFQGIDELTDRTVFLRHNAALAIAQHRGVATEVTADYYSGVAWGEGAGALDHGLFMAVGPRSGGGTAIALSNEGETWFDYNTELFGGLVSVSPLGVAHGGSGALGDRVFVVCGSYNASGTNRPIIMAVPDAADANANPYIPEMNFAAFTAPYQPDDVAGRLHSIAWNGSVFCAVGDGGLIVTLSADLATATVRTPGSSYSDGFRHVHASGSMFIATGQNGEIQRSTNDGATWTRVHSDSDLDAINTGVGLVVGASAENKVLRSTNGGVSWTEIELISPSIFDGGHVTVFELGATLCAILRHATLAKALCFYSFDGGATWAHGNRTPACLGTHVRAAARNTDRAVLVGGSPDGTSHAHITVTGTIIGG